MTMYETNDGVTNAYTPFPPAAPAPVGLPDAEPPKNRRRIAISIAGLLIVGALGAGIAYVAADGADEVEELQSSIDALEEENSELESELDGALADADGVRADLVESNARVAELEATHANCVAATSSFSPLLAAVDE